MVTKLISRASGVDIQDSQLHPVTSQGPPQAHPQMSPSLCNCSLQDPRADKHHNLAFRGWGLYLWGTEFGWISLP